MSSLADRLAGAFKGNIFKGSSQAFHTKFLPTDIPPIDFALGGGFGFGRVHELYGNFSSGKTMVLYKALIANQKRGGESVLAEAEGAFNPEFFEMMGGDADALHLLPVDTCEEVFDAIVKIAKTRQEMQTEAAKKKTEPPVPVVIGWDSIAATGTKHLMDVGMEKRDMSKALIMSQGAQLIGTLVKECDICVIATNQTREKVGSKDSATHTPGGMAWAFQSSQRIELMYDGGSKTSLICDEGSKEELGRWIRGNVTKNKLASPWCRFKLPIYTLPGWIHPEYPGRTTAIGIDVDEALFTFYLDSRFFMPDGQRVLTMPSNGRYLLHAGIDSEQKSFFAKQWPDMLEKYPHLRTLVYDLAPNSIASAAEVSGE